MFRCRPTILDHLRRRLTLFRFVLTSFFEIALELFDQIGYLLRIAFVEHRVG